MQGLTNNAAASYNNKKKAFSEQRRNAGESRDARRETGCRGKEPRQPFFSRARRIHWEGQVTGLASRRDRRRKEGWLSVLFGRSREEIRRERAPRPAPQPERDPIEERRRILRESGPVTGNRRPYSFQIDADAFRSERPSQPAARPANPQTARTQTASPRSQTRSQPARPPQPRTTWPQPVETSRPAQNRTTWPRPVQTARPQQAPASRPQAQRPAAHEVLPEPYRSYYAKVPKKPYYPVAVPRPKPEPERPRPASYSVSEIYGAPRCENSGFVEAPVFGSARPPQKAPAVVSAPCPQPAAPVPDEPPVSIWDRLARASAPAAVPGEENGSCTPPPVTRGEPHPSPRERLTALVSEAQAVPRPAAPAVEAAAPAPVVETAAPAPVVEAAVPAPVVETAAPAPVVETAAPAPVVEMAAPAPVVEMAAPAPAVEAAAPAPVVEMAAQVPAAEEVEEETIWDRLQRAAPVPSDRPAPLVRLSSETVVEAPETQSVFPEQDKSEAELPQGAAPAASEARHDTAAVPSPTASPSPADGFAQTADPASAAGAAPAASPSPATGFAQTADPVSAAGAAPADAASAGTSPADRTPSALNEREQAQALAALLSHAQGTPEEATHAPEAQSLPFEPPILPPSGPGRYVYVDNSDDWDEDPFFTSWDMEQFPEEDFPDEAEEDSGEDEALSGPDEETGSPLPAAETNETTGAAGQQLTPNPDTAAGQQSTPNPDAPAGQQLTPNPDTPAGQQLTPNPDTPDGQQLTPNPDTPDGLLTTGSGAPEPAGSPALSAPQDSSAPAPQTPPQAAAQPVRPAPKQPTAVLPALPTSFLTYSPEPDMDSVEEELNANGEKLIETLQSFGVRATMLEACRGPAVTRYELQPAAGVKISKITNLADDIAMNLAALGVRIEAPIPGKAAVGIEVPNRKVSVVRMRELIESPAFRRAESPLTTVLGRDIAGELVLADLGKMPHLLIAGSTGSGKSVCINSLIVSLLYKSTPQEVRFLMIDPKVVELGIYNGIPHLIVPVVTDPRKAAGALNWAVTEMLRRYQQFAANNVRDLASYNRLAGERGYIDEQGMRMEHMPQIVIIIDELADLMMAAPNEVEDSICRLAQMARAAGMHLVIATQRPSVDVITGIIKANIPSRIAFAVSSQVDSRTILDMGGAEKLLGRGDMLFSPLGVQKPMRVQGCFIDDREIEAVVDFIRKAASAEYDESVMEEIERGGAAEQTESSEEPEGDPMIPEAVRCVVEAGQASTSLLQRRLRLGYARAGRLVDEMEQMGIVGPHEGSKPRQVLISW